MTSLPSPRPHTPVERARALLEGRHVPLLCAAVAVLLTSPSLAGGFATEDWPLRRMLVDRLLHLPDHVNLFGAANPTAEELETRNLEYQLRGWFPWITSPGFDARFLRPLASLTHHLDYGAWPDHPAIAHAQSLLWYGALAAAVAVLYRRLVPQAWAAGLAAVAYAVDDAHGHAVGWLMNRNAVLAALFSVLALWAFDRLRRDAWRPGWLLTPVLVALALASAELALAGIGYFVAHGLFLDRDRPSRRLVGALTWVVPLSAWALVYRALGYSTQGSGLYIHPIANPVRYFLELAERSTVLFMGLFGAPFSDAWTHADPYAQGLVTFWGAVVGLGVLRVLAPRLRDDPQARFWLAGILLSLPPVCAAFPEDRLLLLAGVGAFPLVVQVLASAWPALSRGARPRRTAAVAVLAVAVHLVAAPLLLPYRSLTMARYDARIDAAGESAMRGVPATPGQVLILVNAEDFYFASTLALLRPWRGQPMTPRALTLAGTLGEITLRRIDEQQIEVRPALGFLSRVFDRIARGPDQPFHRGDRIDLRGIDVHVTEINQWGEPTAAVFSFALPLDHERYHWVTFRHGAYEPFAVPPVGATITVRGS